ASVSIPDVIAKMNHQDGTVRVAAIEAVLQLGPNARSALPNLLSLATVDPEPSCRDAAFRAVKQLEPVLETDVPTLSTLLKEMDFEKRLATIKTIAQLKMDSSVTVSLFVPQLKDAAAPLRQEVIRILAALGPSKRSEVFS